MKRKTFKLQKMIAVMLSTIMVVQFTPKELLKVLAEEISSVVEQLGDQKEEIQYSTIFTDENNIGTGAIIQENVHHRTLTSKEYLMSDDTIMVQQFNKPIHYYVNGEYIEIDKAEKELQAEIMTNLSNAVASENFESVNVFENAENVTVGDSVSAGKINGKEKSDLFLNFKLPSVEPYYQLIGAKIKFEYQTQGASLFDSKDYSYNVYVAESENNLKDITYDSKPKKKQELESIQKSSQVSEKSLTYESDIINANNIENGVITLGIESTDATSADGYISTLSDSVETTTFYQVVSGVEDDYSLQTYEIDGATAYINNSTGDLTLNCDLLSIETMSDMPFASSLVYNSNYDELLTELGKTSIAGYGFKLNFQQFMIQDGLVYYLIDADGSISSFHSLGTGEYYSKEKKLYYTPDETISGKGTVRDVLDNQMLFENGRLIKIVSGANASEYIEIAYLTNTDKISQVSYYFGATTPKYKMEFVYDSLGRLWKATSGTSSVEYSKSIIAYNEDGYLTGISNHTGRADTENGVQRLSLEYLEIYISEPKVYLTEIWNNQDDGLMLGYVPGENLTVYRCVGRTMQAGPRELSKDIIYFFGTRTEIISYENNIETGRKNIAFNNKQKVISEWVKDNSGIVSVSNRTNWSNSEDEVNNYVEGYCSYVQKYNNTDFVYVGANQQKTIKFQSPFESEEKTDAYTFAFSFRVVGHYGLDFTVTIGDSNPVKIKTENTVETYISIPYQRFVGDINLTIKNNDTNTENTLSTNDFNYSIVNYTEEKYTYDSGIQAHKLESIEANLKNATNVKTTYDAQQRIQTAVTQNITDAATFETTTYEYIDSGIWKGNVESVVTKDKDNNNTEIVEYTYSGNKEAYSVTQNITKGDLRQYTIQQKEPIGEDGIKLTYTDETGEQYKEYYALSSGDIRLQKVEYDNLYEQYTYNNLGQVTSINVYNASTNTVMYSQTDNYTENGVYIGSSYNGNDFTYTYDDGMVSSIDYKPSTESSASAMLSYTYNTYSLLYGANQITSKTYANYQQERYTYTQNETKVVHMDEDYNVTAQYAFEYDNNRNLIAQTKTDVNNYLALRYAYNNDDIYQPQLAISGGDLVYQVNYTVDIDSYTNQMKKGTLFSAGPCSSAVTHNMAYTYDSYGRIETTSYDLYGSSLSYDKLGRVASYIATYNNNTIRTTEYQYAMNGEYSTNRLIKITNTALYDSTESIATYYPNGYVRSVEYGNVESEYEYDAFGRLTKETNNGTSKSYNYDAYNNILMTGLTYTNGVLTSVNGAPISYDEMGNPTTYKGNAFVWEQGRKLASGRLKGNNFSYAYDGNGMRYQKIVNGQETEYYYNGDQLLMENRGGSIDRIYYIYDASGVAGILIGGSYYYFDKNTLGDVVAIRNEVGVILAQYEYDAWGNHTVTDRYGNTNTSSTFIGNVNPIRYRGYYYDTETGFYYLQTRYYDPTICRFINADNYELVATLSSVPEQLNMYAYCNNNPIMYTDATGCFWDYILDAGFLIWGIYDVIKNPDDWTNWAALGIDVVFAVLPFVTSGGGKVVKLANIADDVTDFRKVTVIGETMTRVQTVSQFVNAADNLYDGFKYYNRLSDLGKGGKVLAEIGGKASNVAWLYGKARRGYTIIDIGIDIKRTTRSSSYITEKIFLSIWQTRNIWKFYQVF